MLNFNAESALPALLGDDLDILRNEIYLTGSYHYIADGTDEPGVEHIMASRFIKNLQIISHNAMDESGELLPIIIHMKTCGGDWQEGMAIYDAIKACPNHTTIVNYTHAQSMSSIIFQAANRRVMMPHSYFMMHEGESYTGGTEKSVRSNHEFFGSALKDQMLNIYVSRAKKAQRFKLFTPSSIKRFFVIKMNDHEEWYLWAKDTVKYGLADEVFTSWTKLRLESK